MKRKFYTHARAFRFSVAAQLLVAHSRLFAARVAAEDLRDIDIGDVPECRARVHFAQEVDQLVGPAAQRSSALRVRFARAGGGVQVQLEVRNAERTARRTLTLPTCDEANDAAVLLAALAIDPTALPSAPSTSSALPEAPSEEPTDKPLTADSGPEPYASSAPPPVTSFAVRTPRSGYSGPPWFVRGGAGLDPRLLGRPSAAAALEFGLRTGALECALGGRYAPTQSLDAKPFERGELEMSAGSVTLRAGALLTYGAFAIVPSAGLLLTTLRAHAKGLDPDPVRRAFVPEPQLALLVAWRVHRRVWLELGTELRFLLRRPELMTDGVVRYRLPALAGQLSLGLRFWTIPPGTSL